MSDTCISCGACCATYRVSFYWGETTAHPEGVVPEELTEMLTPYHVSMIGTNQAQPRCVALQGEIGCANGCRIYMSRSSTCRNFEMASERCNKARMKFGLPPLTLTNLID